MNFNDIYSEIVQNKQNHDNGYYNCIPFIGLNRLEKYLPGIEQGTYYLITASTGVKTKIKHIQPLIIHLKLGNLEVGNQLPSS